MEKVIRNVTKIDAAPASERVPDEASRRRAHVELMQTVDESHRHAEEQGVTSTEADAAVEEIMRQARPRSS